MTRRCFVAGYPITHSRSPLIHGRWIAENNLNATYERIEAKPDDLPALLGKVRDGTLLGGNLTIPLKEAVVPLLDAVTDDARAMGAVNTIFRHNGAVTGANTDVEGFLAHLDLTCPGWNSTPARVLVLGAGGAARAILHGLLSRRVGSITIANRSETRAKMLVEEIGAQRQAAVPMVVAVWPPAPGELAAADVIVNATSLGMKGQPPLELAWPATLDGTIAYDIVYAPLVTPFLAQAAARGGRPVDGLGMLLHQAALAFGHWFDMVPAVTPELRALIEADLVPKDPHS